MLASRERSAHTDLWLVVIRRPLNWYTRSVYQKLQANGNRCVVFQSQLSDAVEWISSAFEESKYIFEYPYHFCSHSVGQPRSWFPPSLLRPSSPSSPVHITNAHHCVFRNCSSAQ